MRRSFFSITSFLFILYLLSSCSLGFVKKNETKTLETASIATIRNLSQIQIKTDEGNLISDIDFSQNTNKEIEKIRLRLYDTDKSSPVKDYTLNYKYSTSNKLISYSICDELDCTTLVSCKTEEYGYCENCFFATYDEKEDGRFCLGFDTEEKFNHSISSIYLSREKPNPFHMCNRIKTHRNTNGTLKGLIYSHHENLINVHTDDELKTLSHNNPFAAFNPYALSSFVLFVNEYIGDVFRLNPILSYISLLILEANKLSPEKSYNYNLYSKNFQFDFERIIDFKVITSESHYPTSMLLNVRDENLKSRNSDQLYLSRASFGKDLNYFFQNKKKNCSETEFLEAFNFNLEFKYKE